MATSKNLQRKGIISFIWVLSSTIGRSLIQFVTLLILARILTPEDFGIVNAAMVIILFFQVFSELGISASLIQVREINHKYISSAVFLSIILGISCCILIFLGAEIVSEILSLPDLSTIVKILGLSLPLFSVSSIGDAILQRNMKHKKSSTIYLISYFIGYALVGIILAINDFKIYSLVYANLTQATIFFLLIVKEVPEVWNVKPYKNECKSILQYGVGYSLSKLFIYLANNGDNFIVAKFLGASSLGFYGRAFQLVVMPAVLISGALEKVFFSVVSNSQKDTEKIAKGYLTLQSSLAILAFPLSGYLYLYGDSLITLLLGKSWQGAILPFKILSLSLCFRMSYKISFGLIRGMGAIYEGAWKQAIYALMVLLAAWFGFRWGTAGVATGVSLAMGLNFFMMMQVTQKLLNFSWKTLIKTYIKSFIITIISLSIAITITSLLERIFIINTTAAILFGSIIGFAIYLGSIYFQKEKFTSEIKLFTSIMSR